MEESQVQAVFEKLKNTSKTLGDEVVHQISLMVQVIKAQLNGTSLVPIPWAAKIFIPMALVYFLCPIDLIPDVVPFVGYLDDIFVIGLVFSWIATFMQLFERSLKYEQRIRELREKGVESLRDDQLCCICLEDMADTVLLPCKHCCSCESCAPLLTTCPLCRNPIKKHSTIFL